MLCCITLLHGASCCVMYSIAFGNTQVEMSTLTVRSHQAKLINTEKSYMLLSTFMCLLVMQSILVLRNRTQ